MIADVTAPGARRERRRVPYGTLALVGLGGLFAGVTGPLLSVFVPVLVRDALGEHRTLIGAVMALDNVLLLALVPLAGALSDRASARGGSRVPLAVAGFVLAAAGMALLPRSSALGISGILAALVLLYTGINVQRSPFQALVADLVASEHRSLATASVTFQMCVGAVAFLMLGRVLGMAPAFATAACTVLLIAVAAWSALHTRRAADQPHGPDETTLSMLLDAARLPLRGDVAGIRAVFLAALLLQLTFQTFSTWYALHATERFNVRAEDVTAGFIAWALGGVAGALPAGALGVRFGRRPTMLAGFGLMCLCMLGLDRVTSLTLVVPLLALASASWTLPTVNAFPLFVEPLPPHRRGVMSALFLLCMALGGGLGDPFNGRLFDLAGGYRPLFLVMATYTALAFLAVLAVPRGAGEAVSRAAERVPAEPG